MKSLVRRLVASSSVLVDKAISSRRRRSKGEPGNCNKCLPVASGSLHYQVAGRSRENSSNR